MKLHPYPQARDNSITKRQDVKTISRSCQDSNNLIDNPTSQHHSSSRLMNKLKSRWFMRRNLRILLGQRWYMSREQSQPTKNKRNLNKKHNDRSMNPEPLILLRTNQPTIRKQQCHLKLLNLSSLPSLVSTQQTIKSSTSRPSLSLRSRWRMDHALRTLSLSWSAIEGRERN
jgi:hypothetical protein